MNANYGQYCPLALAVEILAQRWTILVISRVLMGCHGFNAIHRGVPGISPSLLAQRLRELEDAGIVEKVIPEGSTKPSYHVTPAGQDLAGLIRHVAEWGHTWARDMVHEDLDPGFLAWSMTPVYRGLARLPRPGSRDPGAAHPTGGLGRTEAAVPRLVAAAPARGHAAQEAGARAQVGRGGGEAIGAGSRVRTRPFRTVGGLRS